MKTKILFKVSTVLIASVLGCLIFFGSLLCFAQNFDSVDSTNSNIQSNVYQGTPFGEGVTFSKNYFADLSFTVAVMGNFDKGQDSILQLFDQIDQTLSLIDSIAHPTNENSDIFKFNALPQGGTVEVSAYTVEMLTEAKEIYATTDGAFNPAAYRLVDLWGFSSRTYYKNIEQPLPYDRQWDYVEVYDNFGTYPVYFYPLPQTKYIDAFKQLCDFDSIEILGSATEGYSLKKNCPSVTVDGVEYSQWIDLGAVAKGFCVDLAEQILTELGFEYYYINCAQSSIAFSKQQDGTGFPTALQNPDVIFDLNGYAGLTVANTSLSTSGTYIRNYSVGGKTYSHIINPRTGYPVDSNILTVSIFGGGSGLADCITTALTVLGREGIVNFMNSDYCKTNNLKISALYADDRPFSAGRQILTNMTAEQFDYVSDGFVVATSIEGEQGIVVYVDPLDMTAVVVTLAILICLVLFAIAVARFVVNRRAHKTQNIVRAKADKFFKPLDIAVYAAVVVLIVVLLAIFVFPVGQQIETVRIVSMVTGETLFVFDSSSGAYTSHASPYYDVNVTDNGEQIEVNVTILNDNDVHFNTLTISRENGKLWVKMTDSECGLHQECVQNFPAITSSDGVIVCSPNGIKVTTSADSKYMIY